MKMAVVTMENILAFATPVALIMLAIVQQYQMAKNKADANEAKQAAALAAVKAEEQKRVIDVVHALTNSGMALQLQTAVGFAERIYAMSKLPEDLVTVEKTKALLAEHMAKQAVVDSKPKGP